MCIQIDFAVTIGAISNYPIKCQFTLTQIYYLVVVSLTTWLKVKLNKIISNFLMFTNYAEYIIWTRSLKFEDIGKFVK